MRIARVLTRLNLGGPARQVLASDPRLARRGHELRVFVGSPEPGEGDLAPELESRGVDVVRVPGLARGISPAGDLMALRALRRELAAFKPDVLHTHASKAGALGRSASGKGAATRRVHTFHGHVLEGYFGGALSRGLVAHERRLARRTDRILAVSHATADDLVRLGVCPEEKLTVVPPGIDLEALLELQDRERPVELRRTIGAPQDAVVVGVVGRLAEVKRPEVALEAFLTIAQRHANVHLVFVGDGGLRRDLEGRIRALGAALQQRVHLVGAMTNPREIFGALDVVLLSSRSEGLPVALIEAGAAGLPSVATDVGGVNELVVHERTGFLGNDASELSYGLDQLLADATLRREMGHRARMRVRSRHSAESLAGRLEAVYQAVLEERA